MSVKKVWSASLRHVRTLLVHEWSDDRQTFEGCLYKIRSVFYVKDKDREIEVWMTPDEARAYAKFLLESADEAERAF